MKGIQFYENLKETLYPEQLLGQYKFVKWMRNGGLQFKINARQRKTIPAEVIIAAYHVKNRRIKHRPDINREWLLMNGHSDWCFVEVLNALID